MRKLVRCDLGAALAVTGTVLLMAVGLVSPPPAVAAGPEAITDPTADVIDRNTNDKLPTPRTDIVGATVESGAQGVVLTFRTQEMGAPGTDPNWASLNTFVSWQVDSSGDGKVDSLIRYSADRKTPGAILGDLTFWPGPGQPAKHCTAAATFDPAAGYRLTIANDCLGNPTQISYRVQLTYDTKPGEAKPPLAFDVAPDSGLAGPVPIAQPTAPAQAPAGDPAPGAPAPTQPAAQAPPTSAPKANTPATRSRPTGEGRKPTATTAPARGAASAPKPAPKPAAAPKPATAPAAPNLAATGASAARILGALGGAFLLLGGLGLMTPPARRRRTSV